HALPHRTPFPTRRSSDLKRNRSCRFCGRSATTTFKNVSHAIPQSFGNKNLITLDECDACNRLFSESFEHDFDNYTRPIRTILGKIGKHTSELQSPDHLVC